MYSECLLAKTLQRYPAGSCDGNTMSMKGGRLFTLQEELIESIFANLTERWTIKRDDHVEWTSVCSISKAWRRQFLIMKAKRVLWKQVRRERIWMALEGFNIRPTWMLRRLAWRDPLSGLMRDAWVKRRLGDEGYAVLPVSARRVWSFERWTTPREQEAWEWFDDIRPAYSDIQFVQLSPTDGSFVRVFTQSGNGMSNDFELRVEGIPFNVYREELQDDRSAVDNAVVLEHCWWRGRYDHEMNHHWRFQSYEFRI